MSNAHLWTPSSHAEWLNLHNVLMSAHWGNDMKIYLMTNLILLSNLLFIGMQNINNVSTSINLWLGSFHIITHIFIISLRFIDDINYYVILLPDKLLD